MFYNCVKKKWALDTIGVLFQVIFIFTFLTIFFFIYVVKVEDTSFKKQMTLVVDTILTKENLQKLLDPLENLPKYITPQEEAAAISGAIDLVISKSKISNKNLSETVTKSNKKLKSKAFVLLGISLAVLIIITIILIGLGYCVPILYEIKEALWITLFIGFTELIFLLVVAKNYDSADPNKVKRTIGKAIEDWVNDGHLCPSPCPSPCPSGCVPP